MQARTVSEQTAESASPVATYTKAWPQISTVEWQRAEPPADVASLERLCVDQELTTTEIVEPNAYYGIADIIKRWAGTLRERPLMIALPHGVEYASAKFFTHHELVPVVASYCPDTAQPYRDMPISRLWYMASPYVHVVTMAERHDDSERHGSIFFPQHSTTVQIVEYDVADTIGQLHALPARYHPITVCMYCVDVQRDMHHAYLNAGFEVVSCGHTYDPLFLYRLHRICLPHRFAIHHDFGSAVAFSIRSGCHLVLIAGETRWSTASGVGEIKVLADGDRRLAPEQHALRELARKPYTDQLAWANHVLGSRFLRTPVETAAMVRRAERLDRVGVFAERGLTGRRNPLTIPTMYRRAMRRVVPASVKRPLRPVVARLRVDGSG